MNDKKPDKDDNNLKTTLSGCGTMIFLMLFALIPCFLLGGIEECTYSLLDCSNEAFHPIIIIFSALFAILVCFIFKRRY